MAKAPLYRFLRLIWTFGYKQGVRGPKCRVASHEDGRSVATSDSEGRPEVTTRLSWERLV